MLDATAQGFALVSAHRYDGKEPPLNECLAKDVEAGRWESATLRDVAKSLIEIGHERPATVRRLLILELDKRHLAVVAGRTVVGGILADHAECRG